jgi:hypothetical protein
VGGFLQQQQQVGEAVCDGALKRWSSHFLESTQHLQFAKQHAEATLAVDIQAAAQSVLNAQHVWRGTHQCWQRCWALRHVALGTALGCCLTAVDLGRKLEAAQALLQSASTKRVLQRGSCSMQVLQQHTQPCSMQVLQHTRSFFSERGCEACVRCVSCVHAQWPGSLSRET